MFSNIGCFEALDVKMKFNILYECSIVHWKYQLRYLRYVEVRNILETTMNTWLISLFPLSKFLEVGISVGNEQNKTNNNTLFVIPITFRRCQYNIIFIYFVIYLLFKEIEENSMCYFNWSSYTKNWKSKTFHLIPV